MSLGQLAFYGDSLTIGDGGNLKAIYSANVALTFTSISAVTGQEQPATVTGARVGDDVSASPPNNLGNTALLWNARVSADNTVQVRVINPTAGALTPTSPSTWRITVIRYT